ncbi:MAG: phospholipase A2 [Acidimicrobiia bacterium]
MTDFLPPPPFPPPPPPPEEPHRRSWAFRVWRAIGLGLLTGLIALIALAYWVSSAVGPPPTAADVCREVPAPILESPVGLVLLAEVCTNIDVRLDIALGGVDGFEGEFRKPEPPSDPATPRPDYLVWDSDGCSAPVLGSGPFDFTLACNRHDFGWRNLKEYDTEASPVWMVDNKDRVDAGFLYDMRIRCAVVSGIFRIGCDTTARIYYTAVRLNPSGVDGLAGGA